MIWKKEKVGKKYSIQESYHLPLISASVHQNETSPRNIDSHNIFKAHHLKILSPEREFDCNRGSNVTWNHFKRIEYR